MPKKSDKEKDLASEVVKPSEDNKEKQTKKSETKKSAKQSKPVIRPGKKVKRMNFTGYARRKGFKVQHAPGLRAYCDNPHKLRTLEEWDEHFKGY